MTARRQLVFDAIGNSATNLSNLLTLASTQHGNTLRIENIGSTSWKPISSSLGLARDDDDGNSAIRSADPENPTLEPNMKCIGSGSPVAQTWRPAAILDLM